MDEGLILSAVDKDIAEKYEGEDYIAWWPLAEQLIRELKGLREELAEIRSALDWGIKVMERRGG